MSGAQTVKGAGEARRAVPGRSSDLVQAVRTSPLPGTSICMVIVGLAIVLGGGGTVNPQTEMILQVLTALLMVPLVASENFQRGLGPVQAPAWLLAGLVLAVPILQLMPLPPAIWRALPGREIEIQSLALIQGDHWWMPLTMAPARTFASLLATIFPVLLLLQVSRLSLRGRTWLCVVIVAGGIASLVLGVLQLSHTAGLEWSFYSQFSEGFLVGFQANRNAEADVLLIGILAMGVLVSSRLADGGQHRLTWAALLLGLLTFGLGLFMTGSRTGIALLAVALLFLGAILWPIMRKRTYALYALASGLGIALIGGGLLQFQSIQKVVARFSVTREARWDLWADTWYAIGQVWPFGSGVGTIVPMLEAAERLEVVDTTRPVRAHNDWLEWMLEAGLPGLVILALIFIVLAALIVRAFVEAGRQGANPSRRAHALFACGVLTIEALHAIVDYPLRSMSLAMLTATAVAFLLNSAASQRNTQ